MNDHKHRNFVFLLMFRNDGYGSMILRVYLNLIFHVPIFETMMFCNRGEQISRIVENN